MDTVFYRYSVTEPDWMNVVRFFSFSVCVSETEVNVDVASDGNQNGAIVACFRRLEIPNLETDY